MPTFSVGDRVSFRGATEARFKNDKRYHGVVLAVRDHKHRAPDESQTVRVQWDDGLFAEHYNGSIIAEENAE